MSPDPVTAVIAAKCVLLTTFKRDGTAVATPVWAVADGPDAVMVWTARDAGKVKRIRRSGRVTISPCSMRGRVTGATVDAVATLLDLDGTLRTQDAIARKYGWLGRMLVRRGGQGAVIGIRVDLAP
jgi:PPOX class probable F420-dependent enzyme